MQLDKHIVDKINNAHNSVVDSSKNAIQSAIEAGDLLNRVKSIAGHGEFVPILNSGMFSFSERTARSYMKVSDYSANVQGLADLQSAYRLIESEETKKKQAESVEQRDRLACYPL